MAPLKKKKKGDDDGILANASGGMTPQGMKTINPDDLGEEVHQQIMDEQKVDVNMMQGISMTHCCTIDSAD